MITTFYSYKGGVGRTLAALQTAVSLASSGESVVFWDLDLEAPGVARNPGLQGIARTELGTLDLFESVLNNANLPDRWLSRSLASVAVPTGGGRAAAGTLEFLLPAPLDTEYARRYSGIDWARLFPAEPTGNDDMLGLAALNAILRALHEDHGAEHVIIDARTGLTPLAAHCLLDVAHNVVLVTNLNAQSTQALTGIVNSLRARSNPEDVEQRIDVLRVVTQIPSDELLLDSPQARELRDRSLRRLRDQIGELLEVPLDPVLLADERPYSLAGRPVPPGLQRVVEFLEHRHATLHAASVAARATDPGPADLPDELRRRLRGADAHASGKQFEEYVGELFELDGYQVTVGYKTNDMQFDLLLEKPHERPPRRVLVECKNEKEAANTAKLLTFANKVRGAEKADGRRYEGVFVAKRFAENAWKTAETEFLSLYTDVSLARNLIDLPGLARSAGQRWLENRASDKFIAPFARRKDAGDATFALDALVDEWLATDNQPIMALLGNFGTGKSVFSAHLAATLADRFRENPDIERAPVLIDLRTMNTTTGQLINMVLEVFQTASLPAPRAEAFRRANEAGSIVLIVDGFDEMLAYTETRQLLASLQGILSVAEGRAKLLLTGRTGYFRDEPEEQHAVEGSSGSLTLDQSRELYRELSGRNARIVYLDGFTDEQIDQYVHRAAPEHADRLRELLADDSGLMDLAHRPFLLDLIVQSAPRLFSVPRDRLTRTVLYETYAESWFESNTQRTRWTGAQRRSVAQRLARLMWNTDGAQVHWRVLANSLTDLVPGTTDSMDMQAVDAEIRTASFLSRDALGNYRFAHRSFLEFFVADFIRAHIDSGAAVALDLRALTGEVYEFLDGFGDQIGGLGIACERLLVDRYVPQASENALLWLWRTTRAAPDGAQLQGAWLPAKNLSGIRLRNADLTGASLHQTLLLPLHADTGEWRPADLTECKLVDVGARGLMADSAILAGVDASGADLAGADLTNADLTGASFTGAVLDAATIVGVRGFSTEGLRSQRRVRQEVTQIDHAESQVSHTSSNYAIHVAWSPNGTQLATGDNESIRIWDTTTNETVTTLTGYRSNGSGALTVAWSPDGTQLATGDNDTVRIWDTTTNETVTTLTGYRSNGRGALTVAWSPDGTQLATGDNDTVRIWNTTTNETLTTLTGQSTSWGGIAIAWSPDGTRLATGDNDTVRIWNTTTNEIHTTLTGHTPKHYRAITVAWSPNGTQLATGDNDTARIWNTTTNEVHTTLTGHTPNHYRAITVAWSPNGTQLATGDQTTIRIWNTTTNEIHTTLTGHTPNDNGALTVAWSADGTQLATGDRDTARIWDTTTKTAIATFRGHTTNVYGVVTAAWSPDGTQLATGDQDTVRVWDTATARAHTILTGHTTSFHGAVTVGWSPDGTQLASGDRDTVRIWDPATGTLLGTLVSTPDGDLAFTPEGAADGDFAAIDSFLRWIAPSPEGPLAYRAKHVPHLVNKGLVAKALARS